MWVRSGHRHDEGLGLSDETGRQDADHPQNALKCTGNGIERSRQPHRSHPDSRNDPMNCTGRRHNTHHHDRPHCSGSICRAAAQRTDRRVALPKQNELDIRFRHNQLRDDRGRLLHRPRVTPQRWTGCTCSSSSFLVCRTATVRRPQTRGSSLDHPPCGKTIESTEREMHATCQTDDRMTLAADSADWARLAPSCIRRGSLQGRCQTAHVSSRPGAGRQIDVILS